MTLLTMTRMTHLFGKDGDVLVEGFGGADVAASHPRLPRRACGEFTLLEDQRQKGEQRVPAGGNSIRTAAHTQRTHSSTKIHAK